MSTPCSPTAPARARGARRDAWIEDFLAQVPETPPGSGSAMEPLTRAAGLGTLCAAHAYLSHALQQ